MKELGVDSAGQSLAGKAETTVPVIVQAAVVQDPDAQKKLLENVRAIMDENMPMVKKNILLQETK